MGINKGQGMNFWYLTVIIRPCVIWIKEAIMGLIWTTGPNGYEELQLVSFLIAGKRFFIANMMSLCKVICALLATRADSWLFLVSIFFHGLKQSIPILGFERDKGKVSIHRGIGGQGINAPLPFTLNSQGGGVLPLSCPQKMFSTGAKV